MHTADALLSKIRRNPDKVVCEEIKSRHRSGYLTTMKWIVSKELSIEIKIDDYRCEGTNYIDINSITITHRKWFGLVSSSVVVGRKEIDSTQRKLIVDVVKDFHPMYNIWYWNKGPAIVDLDSLL